MEDPNTPVYERRWFLLAGATKICVVKREVTKFRQRLVLYGGGRHDFDCQQGRSVWRR